MAGNGTTGFLKGLLLGPMAVLIIGWGFSHPQAALILGLVIVAAPFVIAFIATMEQDRKRERRARLAAPEVLPPREPSPRRKPAALRLELRVSSAPDLPAPRPRRRARR